ncbi:MAG: hypothetical protein PVS3B3_20730 [Ktedonobacteraceae bacterium]
MQPLLTHNLLDLGILLASLLIWRVMDASVDIRTYKRLHAGASRRDKGSHVVVLCLIVFGLLLGILLALKVPGTALTNASLFLFWLGIFLMYVGIALRLYAITILGAFFTATVAVAPEQTVIEAGIPSRIMCRDKTLVNECFAPLENAFPEEKKAKRQKDKTGELSLYTT